MLRNGQTVLRDLDEFPVLKKASAGTRRNYEIHGRGLVALWPELDERIGVSEVLRIPEESVARSAGFNTRKRTAFELILEGERKQEIANDISELIGREPRRL